MHSIRTKITAMTLSVIIIIMSVSTVFGVIAIKNIGTKSADKMLLLLCETGQNNLNHYFESVEQSVEMVSAYVESDLDGVDDAHLQFLPNSPNSSARKHSFAGIIPNSESSPPVTSFRCLKRTVKSDCLINMFGAKRQNKLPSGRINTALPFRFRSTSQELMCLTRTLNKRLRIFSK